MARERRHNRPTLEHHVVQRHGSISSRSAHSATPLGDTPQVYWSDVRDRGVSKTTTRNAPTEASQPDLSIEYYRPHASVHLGSHCASCSSRASAAIASRIKRPRLPTRDGCPVSSLDHPATGKRPNRWLGAVRRSPLGRDALQSSSCRLLPGSVATHGLRAQRQ
jgi:hypothetical protein